MFDLTEELTNLVSSCDKAGIEYAVCGGLAMAVHGMPRATIDIDLLIDSRDYIKVREIANKLGYIIEALPMTFSNSQIKVSRFTKIDPDTHDMLTIDFLQVTPALEDVWSARELIEWQYGRIWVVSRNGLIKMKRMRSSKQDLADIEKLEEKLNDH